MTKKRRLIFGKDFHGWAAKWPSSGIVRCTFAVTKSRVIEQYGKDIWRGCRRRGARIVRVKLVNVKP